MWLWNRCYYLLEGIYFDLVKQKIVLIVTSLH